MDLQERAREKLADCAFVISSNSGSTQRFSFKDRWFFAKNKLELTVRFLSDDEEEKLNDNKWKRASEKIFGLF